MANQELLANTAFYRIYFEQELAMPEIWELPDREQLAREAETLERIFGADDPELRQRLSPRLVPPAAFDAEDRAAARALLGRHASISLDEGPGLSVLRQVAARRRLPADVQYDLIFPEGYRWRVTFAPAAISHSLLHADFPDPLELGSRDAHFTLPILRWAEVQALVRHLDSHERVLLLTTAWLDAKEDRAPVLGFVRGVLREAGVLRDEQAAELAERLLTPIDVGWRKDASLGWICERGHSVRNPETDALDSEGFDRLRAFLDAAGAR